jgi:hypothetical protein
MKRTTILLLAASASLLAACDPSSAATPKTGASATGIATSAGEAAPRPCTAEHVEVVIAPGKPPKGGIEEADLVLTNLGPHTCTLAGASDLEFYGVHGDPIGIVDHPANGDWPTVVLAAGKQAFLAAGYPTGKDSGCSLSSGTFAEVTLPGETRAIKASYVDSRALLPPVCGRVVVTPWRPGDGR